MSTQMPVVSARFQTRRLFASLSLVAATSIIGGSLLRAEHGDGATEPSAVVLRAKPSMSRQPRPSSAPIRHLDQRVDAAVVLLGIEAIDDSTGTTVDSSSMGEWTPRR